MLGEEDDECLYSAPNWYCSHIIASNQNFVAYGARSFVQILSLTLKPVKVLTGHIKRVTSVCFTAQNKLISTCDGGTVRLWDVESGESNTLLPGSVPITAVCSSSYNAVSADEKGFINVWAELKEGKEGRYQPFSEKILTMAFSKQGGELAVGYKMGTAAVMQIHNTHLTLLYALKGHDSDVFSVSWSSSEQLATISRDKTVKIWDGKELLVSVGVPPNTTRDSLLNKEQPWAALAWSGTKLIASSSTGTLAELLTEDIASGGEWKVYEEGHNKKVFCICTLEEGVLVTTAMDRSLRLWSEGRCTNVAHGLGGFAYGLDISPLAPCKVAVAVGDNMVRIWDKSKNTVIQVWQSVRTKVMVVAWHPYKEGLLAYGTEEGRVGLYNNGTTHTSSTHHDKAVYCLSWGYAPTKFAQDQCKTALYSCGGEGNILCHRPKELGKPALNVNGYLAAQNKYKHVAPGRTAIDWHFELKLLAVGCNTGLIEVFQAPHLQQLIILQYHTRIVNKLSWNTECKDKLLLASCSDDNTVCVQNLSNFIDPDNTIDENNGVPTMKPDICLRGHTARITDIDWSPHNPSYLVSTSYDGTAQVWDIESSQAISNYRGHTGRVFCARWSHTSQHHIFTGSDQFTVRQWNYTENSHTEPPATNQLMPGQTNRRRKKKKAVGNTTNNNVIANTCETPTETPSIEGSWRSPAVRVGDGKRKKVTKGKSILPLTSRRDHLPKVEQSSHILRIAQDLYSTESGEWSGDIGLYSSRLHTFTLMKEERENHQAEGHHSQSTMLAVWQSDIAGIVEEAIENKTVSEMLLSVAVAAGGERWRRAVKCYISQLLVTRDYVSAATYMSLLGDVEDAVRLLSKEEFYREAIALAKVRLIPTHPIITELYLTWAVKQEVDMQLDSAAKCYLAANEPTKAVMVLLRRKDSASLTVALQVAEITQQHEQLTQVVQEALKEAVERETVELIEQGVEHIKLVDS